jgi:hypothetical protein
MIDSKETDDLPGSSAVCRVSPLAGGLDDLLGVRRGPDLLRGSPAQLCVTVGGTNERTVPQDY